MTTDVDSAHGRLDLARRWLWVGLLTVASLAFSRVFACAMPFVALATLAALNMRRAEAAVMMLIVWLANQAVGFLLLHYPHRASTYEWGLAMGVAAFLGLGGALVVRQVLRAPALVVGAAAFAMAFVLEQGGLCLNSLAVGQGLADYTPAIVGRMLEVNAAALAILVVLNAVAVRAHLVPARPRPALA
jgi:hypothetical protein